MSLPAWRRPDACAGIVCGMGMTLGMLWSADPRIQLACLVFPVLLLALVVLFRGPDLSRAAGDLAILLLGLAYVPLLLAHAGLLRDLPFGRSWIFLVLFIVMASDSLAYFVGRRWGRRKLYPAVSPNKSVEGACGGFAGGLLGALIVKISFFPELRWLDVALLGGIVGIFSQLGDLVESLFKRSFGVKDSGNLIPGHGGVLDRLDSLLFAFPPTFYYVVWVYL